MKTYIIQYKAKNTITWYNYVDDLRFPVEFTSLSGAKKIKEVLSQIAVNCDWQIKDSTGEVVS